MRAIVLSAGRGRRMLPDTAHTPKCLLPVRGRETLLEHQLHTLAACGVREAVVVVGHGAERVEALLRARPVAGIRTRCVLNPLYRTTDNLVSAWLGVRELEGDLLLLNGDTLIDPAILERVLAEARAPLALATDRKPAYDADDMKVALAGGRVTAVDKRVRQADAESIGLLLLRGRGPELFREALEACLAQAEGLTAYYLAAVDRLARRGFVEAIPVDGAWWQEIDTESDWQAARAHVEARRAPAGVAPRRRCALLAIAVASLGLVGPRVGPVRAEEPEARPTLDLRGGADDWLHGPSLSLAPGEGLLRPYIVGGGGVDSRARRLGVADPTGRFRDEPYAGRVGGGLRLHLDPLTSLALEGSTLVRPEPAASEPEGLLGLNLELRF